jgi:hypothetical protein
MTWRINLVDSLEAQVHFLRIMLDYLDYDLVMLLGFFLTGFGIIEMMNALYDDFWS